jgi:ubiquitin-conjugating enzyme E2 J2
MRGPDDSPYAGGEYHGVLLFTSNYPFAPPGIKMFTPSGRFQVCDLRGSVCHLSQDHPMLMALFAFGSIAYYSNLQPDRKICSSFSDFHPGSWNPAWSVSTILTGLLSFMLSDEITTGSVRTSIAEKKAFASKSHDWNCKNIKFKTIFPDYATPSEMKRLPNMGELDLGKPDGPALPKNLAGPTASTSTSSSSIGSENTADKDTTSANAS